MRRHIKAVIIFAAAFLTAAAGSAANFSVTNVFELDAALSAAETNSENDVIYLSGGTYRASDLGGTPITYLAGTNPVENFSITLQGTNGSVIIDGNFQRAMSVDTRIPGRSQNDAHVTLKDMTIMNGFITINSLVGAGLYIQTQHANITLENLTITSNRCSATFQDPHCAGAYVRSQGSGVITIDDCIFTYNEADGNAGALQLMVGAGGSATLRNNIFAYNTCAARGGALYASIMGTLTMNHNTFIGNTNEGWAAWCNGGGAHIYEVSDTAVASVNNNIFWMNAVDGGQGDDIFFENDGNSNSVGAINVFTGNNYTELESTVSNNVTMAANISADPLFTSEPLLYLTLQSNSPCIDTASDLGVTNDIYMIPRALDGDNDNAASPDMGAHEYVHPSADTDKDGMTDAWECTNGINATISNGVDGASGNPDGDYFTNYDEYTADTDPRDETSYLSFTNTIPTAGSQSLYWQGGNEVTQIIERAWSLGTGTTWTAIYTNHPPTVSNETIIASTSNAFYRIRAVRD